MLLTRLRTRAVLSHPPLLRLQLPIRRSESTYQPPTPPPGAPQGAKTERSNHGDFYKTFGRPLAKNFLIAVATYQVLYFTWIKLESYETKREGEGEVKSVEGELRGLVGGGGKEG